MKNKWDKQYIRKKSLEIKPLSLCRKIAKIKELNQLIKEDKLQRERFYQILRNLK